MSYYYDIILNWNEEEGYSFYEWNDTDNLELVKKIPFFKIKHKNFRDFIRSRVRVDNNFLDMIKDRTIISGKNIINKINYAALITDGKNVVALEFDKDGLCISQSRLLVDDELNILEIAYTLKESVIEYKIEEEYTPRGNLRQIDDAKKFIYLELNSLYKAGDVAKLRYLNYEYLKEDILDIDKIYNRMIDELEKDFNKNTLKLYYIIRKSYHKV